MSYEKTFKKRIVLYAEDKYIVQWSFYRFIPIWHTLAFWFQQTLTGNTECWSINLWKYQDAVSVAKALQSISDVDKYYAPHKEKEKAFYEAKKAYYAKAVPVERQNIT